MCYNYGERYLLNLYLSTSAVEDTDTDTDTDTDNLRRVHSAGYI